MIQNQHKEKEPLVAYNYEHTPNKASAKVYGEALKKGHYGAAVAYSDVLIT
jgi:hypothetical protein